MASVRPTERQLQPAPGAGSVDPSRPGIQEDRGQFVPNRRYLLATLAAAGVVAAVRPAFPADTVPPAIAERLAEARTRLDLTPGQEAQLRPLVEERYRRMLAIRDQYVPESTGAGQWSGASRRAL